jgi:PTS system fructose-specific IIA component
MENIMTKDMIVLGLEASTKEEAIEKLAKVFEKQDKLTDFNDYVKHVFEREERFPTAVGFGVATPHGKCDSVRQACVAFARLKNEIQWSKDEKVKYIFLIAVPDKDASDAHLKILAQLSRKIMREEFRKKLMDADDVDMNYKVLTE